MSTSNNDDDNSTKDYIRDNPELKKLLKDLYDDYDAEDKRPKSKLNNVT